VIKPERHHVIAERSALPAEIVMDNGPELASKALDRWAYDRDVRLSFIAPGKPAQNCFVESFNGKFRDECLNEHRFTSRYDARRIVETWKLEYNRERPHSSLGTRHPRSFGLRHEAHTRAVGPGCTLTMSGTQIGGRSIRRVCADASCCCPHSVTQNSPGRCPTDGTSPSLRAQAESIPLSSHHERIVH
jgi:Integrase core domain